MKNDMFEQFTKLNKTAAESLKALTDINVKAFKALTEKQYEIFNIYLDAGSQQVALASEANELDKLISAQTKLARDTGEKVVAVATSSQEIANTYKTELTSWVEKGVQTAQSTVKKAA